MNWYFYFSKINVEVLSGLTMRLCEYIKADIYRFFEYEYSGKHEVSLFQIISTIIRHEELKPLIWYRIGRWIVVNVKKSYIRKPLIFFWSTINYLLILMSRNICIHLGADIGKGLYLHHGPIWIGPTKIGEYCNFSMMDLIGFGGRDENFGIPVIGDRVFLGPGAILTGKIKIGSNVAVGANAVVTKDVPDNCTVGGIPARILNKKGSDCLIEIRKV